MNERIRELAEQAYQEQDPELLTNASRTFEHGIWLSGYSKKFAELIVKECFDCIDVMEKIAYSTNASIPKDYDKHTYIETLDTMRGLLKTHFGVEE